MCVVSAVMDMGRQQWPDLGDPAWRDSFPIIFPPGRPPTDASPIAPLTPLKPAPTLPTQAEIEAFLALYRAAQKFDEVAKQPDCEDPEKIKLLDAILALQKRLEQVEGKLDADAQRRAEEAEAFTDSVKR